MDCFVTDPQNNVLYNEKKKQYDSFSHTTAMEGVYKVCFSNEFSTFTHKIVYLEFRHGDEEPLLESMTSSTALTQVGPTTWFATMRKKRCRSPLKGHTVAVSWLPQCVDMNRGRPLFNKDQMCSLFCSEDICFYPALCFVSFLNFETHANTSCCAGKQKTRKDTIRQPKFIFSHSRYEPD